MRWIFVLIGLSTLMACRDIPYEASPLDPRLPAFSADGTNTAGAYIDGYSWLASRSTVSYEPHFTICTNPDSVGTRILVSNGFQIIEDDLQKRDVGFFLGDLSIRYKNQLLELRDTVINLDGVSNYGMLILDSESPDTLRYGVGKLYIRDVISKPGLESLIVSGTFGFDIKSNGLNHTVYSGRFDYRIKDSNFCYSF
ncbi:hypothetical protein G3O08_04390 [Cryomorpha ignava]|uniref:Uncharacterized protein n=1 Tax=Cryomorpha ignava TaxID=101383 RepID=A0A7K3WMN6_9FLAO|nr:hypothetical protein [Cryomorpha ignava]NEN22744.1 hypothetical protein [Cryomorpha ignava]